MCDNIVSCITICNKKIIKIKSCMPQLRKDYLSRYFILEDEQC